MPPLDRVPAWTRHAARRLTALGGSIVRMPCLAKLARRAPDEHDRRLRLLRLRRRLERAKVLPRDEEGRREVRARRRLPLRETHLRQRHRARLVVRVVDHDDLDRTEWVYGRRCEELLNSALLREVGLQGAEAVGTELLHERVERGRLGVVVCRHACTDL